MKLGNFLLICKTSLILKALFFTYSLALCSNNALPTPQPMKILFYSYDNDTPADVVDLWNQAVPDKEKKITGTSFSLTEAAKFQPDLSSWAKQTHAQEMHAEGLATLQSVLSASHPLPTAPALISIQKIESKLETRFQLGEPTLPFDALHMAQGLSQADSVFLERFLAHSHAGFPEDFKQFINLNSARMLAKASRKLYSSSLAKLSIHINPPKVQQPLSCWNEVDGKEVAPVSQVLPNTEYRLAAYCSDGSFETRKVSIPAYADSVNVVFENLRKPEKRFDLIENQLLMLVRKGNFDGLMVTKTIPQKTSARSLKVFYKTSSGVDESMAEYSPPESTHQHVNELQEKPGRPAIEILTGLLTEAPRRDGAAITSSSFPTGTVVVTSAQVHHNGLLYTASLAPVWIRPAHSTQQAPFVTEHQGILFAPQLSICPGTVSLLQVVDLTWTAGAGGFFAFAFGDNLKDPLRAHGLLDTGVRATWRTWSNISVLNEAHGGVVLDKLASPVFRLQTGIRWQIN